MVHKRGSAQIIPFRLRPVDSQHRTPFVFAFKDNCDHRLATPIERTPASRTGANIGPARGAIAAFVFTVILAIIAGFIVRGLMQVPHGEAQAGLTDRVCALHDFCGRGY
jgi:hypothetical protein